MKTIIQALRMLFVFSIITGVIYPLTVTSIAQGIFPRQARGTLILREHEVVGSSLIAQSFKDSRYFWPRPSAVDYNPLPSGGSNLGPTSKDLFDKIRERQSRGFTHDLLFASASGLDPHICPAAAQQQMARVATARKLDEEQIRKLRALVETHIEKPQWGFLGEPRVNVLELNLSLKDEFKN